MYRTFSGYYWVIGGRNFILREVILFFDSQVQSVVSENERSTTQIVRIVETVRQFAPGTLKKSMFGTLSHSSNMLENVFVRYDNLLRRHVIGVGTYGLFVFSHQVVQLFRNVTAALLAY